MKQFLLGIFLLISSICFANNKVDTTIYGENIGYYGSNYTDQQLYDLYPGIGASATRSTLNFQQWQAGGANLYKARLIYPYTGHGMIHNTLFLTVLDPRDGGPTFTGEKTVTYAGGRSLIPTGLYDTAFLSNGNVNPTNLWAVYNDSMARAVGGAYQYVEVMNEPDYTPSSNNYLTNSQCNCSTSWQSAEPVANDLTNLNDSLENYVQMCKVSNQIWKKRFPNVKIATGGISSAWFYQWFLQKGGGQWIDVLSLHLYPYYAWTYCEFNGATNTCTGVAANGDKGAHRNSDFAIQIIDSTIAAMRTAETNAGASHLPIMTTEGGVPAWSTSPTGPGAVFPNNKLWGSVLTQQNFTIKSLVEYQRLGFVQTYLYQLGQATAPGITNAGVFASFGAYGNLSAMTPSTATLATQGIPLKYYNHFLHLYTVDVTQPSVPTGLGLVRFDSSGNKIYVLWAKVAFNIDSSETASGSYTLPTGATFVGYNSVSGAYLGSFTGGTAVSLTATPYYLIQQSGVVTPPPPTQAIANAGSTQVITLPTSALTLNGTASTGATSYAWIETSGPNSASLTNNLTATAGVSGLVAGVYKFTLTVSNSNGSNTATQTDTVKNAVVTPPPPPTRTLVDAYTYITSRQVTLTYSDASSVTITQDSRRSRVSYTQADYKNGIFTFYIIFQDGTKQTYQ